MEQISKNIFLVKNILTDEQREELLETSKPLLLDLGDDFPGKQTFGILHTVPKLKSIFDCMLQHIEHVMNYKFDIKNAWVNWTNGKNEDLNWHIHSCHYSMVYYMSPFNCGTLFRDKFIIVDNNDPNEPPHIEVFKRVKQLANKKVTNGIAKRWIANELEMKKRV